MWTESQIKNFKLLFLSSIIFCKMPPELAVDIILKTYKLIDEFFEKTNNMDSSEIRRIEQKSH